ncbi:MAG TPA: hypothetical protein VE988_25960, partial [Gemmataceae bacterium]|nr:hypothetical protein [Gemmataceae bacterium]
MNVHYVPLLQIQRDLYRLPRTQDRFRRYLGTLSPDGNTVEMPPLVFMNPMAKDHVAALLDSMLALNADAIASRAVDEACAQTTDAAGDFKIGLVIADDLLGGWTNRYDGEFNIRFGSAPVNPTTPRPKWLKDYWLTAVCWSSESVTEQSIREAIQTAVHRQAYVQHHGPARTLRDKLRQEGQVLQAAGCTGPWFDDEEIAYTREVLTPFLDADDKRTTI